MTTEMPPPEETSCVICREPCKATLNPPYRVLHCSRCGDYRYNQFENAYWFEIKRVEHQIKLSGWVREQNEVGIVPSITAEVANRIDRMRVPSLRDRANRILGIIAKKYPDLDQLTNYSRLTGDLEIQAKSYSANSKETMRLILILQDDGYLDAPPRNDTHKADSVRLNVKGMLAAESLGSSRSNSAQGFVAMWFDESLQDAWTNGFDPGIRAAGYSPLRIDDKDYVGGISDEIIAEIRRSRFVVVDYTGQRNGVYFEAGFAFGLGLMVIPTCREDEMGKLHFDIKHLNTLPWKKPAELADGLDKRIRAVVGAGPDFRGP